MKRKNAKVGVEVIIKSTGEKGFIDGISSAEGNKHPIFVETTYNMEWYALDDLKLANKGDSK